MNFFEEKETDQEIEERKQKNINANYDTGLYSNDLVVRIISYLLLLIIIVGAIYIFVTKR